MLGRNREEHDLTKLLASTLVEREVLGPMEKIGWGHGAPPAPEAGGPPATPGEAPAAADPARPADPAAPKADTPPSRFEFNVEDFKNPTTGKYFDKYDTPAEAMKGLGHLAHMAKTSFSERDAERTRASALESELARLRTTPAVSPTAVSAPSATESATTVDLDKAREALDMVLSNIAEDGGVLDTDSAKKLADAQRELMRQEARFAVAETRDQEKVKTDAENARWTRVNEYMSHKYPNAEKFANEIGLFISSDPLLSEAVAALVARGKEIEASELAWISYERSVKSNETAETRAAAQKTEDDLLVREQVRKEATERARRDAGIVTGSPGGAGIHQTPNQSTNREAIDYLAAEMRRSGEAPGTPAAAAWRKAVIKLDPSVFGPQ